MTTNTREKAYIDRRHTLRGEIHKTEHSWKRNKYGRGRKGAIHGQESYTRHDLFGEGTDTEKTHTKRIHI